MQYPKQACKEVGNCLIVQKGVGLIRIVLHIGPPKTGTSTLQSTMHARRSDLLDAGILYPVSPDGNAAQHGLHPLLVPEDRVWTERLRSAGGDRARMLADSWAHWDFIQSQVAVSKPHTLLLSSESFFVGVHPESALLWPELIGMSDDIQVVAYLREPVSIISAAWLENAKREELLNGPSLLRYREVLESYEQLPKAKLCIRKYDRKDLTHNDIVDDFSVNYLNGTLKRLARLSATNPTLSAEAMQLFRRFKELTNGTVSGSLFERDYRMLKHLARVDARVPYSKKSGLKLHVRQSVSASFQDAQWLKDRWSIDFAINETAANTLPENVFASETDKFKFEDLFDIDDGRRTQLFSEMKTKIPEIWYAVQKGSVLHPTRLKFSVLRKVRRARRWIRRLGIGQK